MNLCLRNTEWIPTNTLFEKHIKLIRINPNISKYWEFEELKELVLDKKSNMTSKYDTNFLLLYAITNKKTIIGSARYDVSRRQDFSRRNTFQ